MHTQKVGLDLHFIEQEVSSYLSEPEMIFLGGSQASHNGRYVTNNSDFDLLIIGENVEYPISTSVLSPNGEHLELIMRDRQTLAYDIEEGQKIGYGTLITNVASGIALMDGKDNAHDLKDSLRRIYEAGPNPIYSDSLKKQWLNLADKLTVLREHHNASAMHMLIVPDVAHTAAKVALRSVGTWSGKGKLLGRFMLDHIPDFKMGLESTVTKAINGDTSGLFALLSQVGPALKADSISDLPFVSFKTILPFPEKPKDREETFYYLVRSDDARWAYRSSAEDSVREQAESWLRFKYDVVRKPIEPERLGRQSNEYFYALARYTGYLMEAAIVNSDKLPGTMSLEERAVCLLDKMPGDAQQILQDAYAGCPGEYLGFGDELMGRIVSLDGPLLPRISPKDCRRDPSVYGF